MRAPLAGRADDRAAGARRAAGRRWSPTAAWPCASRRTRSRARSLPRFGGPVTTTSANRAGEPPASTADAVRAALGRRLPPAGRRRDPGRRAQHAGARARGSRRDPAPGRDRSLTATDDRGCLHLLRKTTAFRACHSYRTEPSFPFAGGRRKSVQRALLLAAMMAAGASCGGSAKSSGQTCGALDSIQCTAPSCYPTWAAVQASTPHCNDASGWKETLGACDGYESLHRQRRRLQIRVLLRQGDWSARRGCGASRRWSIVCGGKRRRSERRELPN